MANLVVSTLPWRLELFYKSPAELAAQLPFLRAHNITRFNLPNKVQNQSQDLIGAVQALASGGIQGLDICVHYVGGPLRGWGGCCLPACLPALPDRQAGGITAAASKAEGRPLASSTAAQSVKYNYERSPAGAAAKLDAFYAELHAACPPGTSLSLLVISGGSQKKRYDSVTAVQQLARRHAQPPLPLHVAFNPYLPEGRKQEEERLRRKLAGAKAAGIYLQVGTDLARLEEALQHVTTLVDELYGSAPGARRPAIHGCVCQGPRPPALGRLCAASHAAPGRATPARVPPRLRPGRAPRALAGPCQQLTSTCSS
jgi:hypothetical protein